MPEIRTIADFWDCEIEHSEVKSKWVNEHLLYIIYTEAGRRNLTKWDVESALRKMAEEQAVTAEWDNGHRLQTFSDGSRLGLVAPGAGRMGGSSRVLEPGESSIGSKIRGGRPYIHGSTKTAWHWTRNGKQYGKADLVWAVTGTPCPQSGLWVRRFCDLGCGDRQVWKERFAERTTMPYCADCRSSVTYGWATP